MIIFDTVAFFPSTLQPQFVCTWRWCVCALRFSLFCKFFF